jgi:hypothetical protein
LQHFLGFRNEVPSLLVAGADYTAQDAMPVRASLAAVAAMGLADNYRWTQLALGGNIARFRSVYPRSGV